MNGGPTPRPSVGHRLYGPTCPCGNPKAKQAHKCQDCRTVEKRKPLDEQYLDSRRTGARVIGSGRYVEARIRAQVVSAAASATGELSELIAAQSLDDRLGSRSRDRWMLSLDDVDRYGRPLHDVVAA